MLTCYEAKEYDVYPGVLIMAYAHPNPSSEEEACSKWQQANPHLPASDDNVNPAIILAKRKLDVADD